MYTKIDEITLVQLLNTRKGKLSSILVLQQIHSYDGVASPMASIVPGLYARFMVLHRAFLGNLLMNIRNGI